MPATIQDVAARAGVSTATVSRILSGASRSRPETRARVLEAVKELGYRPSGIARSLKLRKTRTLGLIVTDIENPYFPELVKAVEDATWERGYALLLCNAVEDPEREAGYLELLAERRVDGIIVAASRIGEHHAGWLARPPVPVVLLNCETDLAGVPAVLSDNRAGGRLATEHLLSLGHRRIGHLAGPPSAAAAEPRLAGSREALAVAGLDPAGLLVAQGDGHISGGERAMGELLAADLAVTGVTCYNDLTAIGAIRALRTRGLAVPADVSVVGFDDLDLSAYIEPPLTTITQQKTRMALWAVERLVRELDQTRRTGGEPADDAPRIVRMPVSLHVRASTAAPRSARR